MMEWRIFLPSNAGKDARPVDVWSLLDLGKVTRHLGPEERRDVYIAGTEGVGLKVRGSKELLEIKLRGQRYPCGAEEWNKVDQLTGYCMHS